MFSEDKSVMPNYISMYGAPDFTFNYGNEQIPKVRSKTIFDELRQKYENGTIKMDDYLKAKQFGIINVQKPTLAQILIISSHSRIITLEDICLEFCRSPE
jgi:hypothetical protein